MAIERLYGESKKKMLDSRLCVCVCLCIFDHLNEYHHMYDWDYIL